MSDIIKLLPDHVANQIAAGEVVQRPASIVKELMENSIDAGATKVELIIRDAGKNLIQVVDNGSGMSDTDARLAFERHATSKISTKKDIFNFINTLNLNNCHEPLPLNEIKSITNSIYKRCQENSLKSGSENPRLTPEITPSPPQFVTAAARDALVTPTPMAPRKMGALNVISPILSSGSFILPP